MSENLKDWDIKPGIAPLIPFLQPNDFFEAYDCVRIKTYVYNLYGNSADIMSPDGPGTILSLHGRAVYIALKIIKVNQQLHGRADSTGGGLHRCYLHQEYNCPLIVRSLKSITDIEAIKIARTITELNSDECNVIFRSENFIEVGNSILSITIAFSGSISANYDAFTLPAYDLARQFGFALPIYWKCKTWLIDDLVKMQLFQIA